MDWRSSRRSRSGREAFLEVREAQPEAQEWLGGSHGGQGVVGKPSRSFESGRKWLGGLPGVPGGPPKGPGVFGRPSQRSGCGREALPEFWEWSGVVGNASRRSKSGQKDLLVVRERSGGPLGGALVVGRPSRTSGRPSRRSESGWEALPEVRERSRGPPEGPGVVGSSREALP